MRIAFALFKYFPFGGLQRDFMQQIRQPGLEQQVTILKGRNDIPRFLLGADFS